jgi:hypothetical protein
MVLIHRQPFYHHIEGKQKKISWAADFRRICPALQDEGRWPSAAEAAVVTPPDNSGKGGGA